MKLQALILAAVYGTVLAQSSNSGSDSPSATQGSSADSDTASKTDSPSASASATDSAQSSAQNSDNSNSASNSGSASATASVKRFSKSAADSTTAKPSVKRFSKPASVSVHRFSKPAESESGAHKGQTTQITATFSPGVPDNSKNPFLEKEHLPEGTLFIACGSILGGIFLGVLIWRIADAIASRRDSKLTQEKYQELNDGAGAKLNKVEADYDLAIPGTFDSTPQLFFSPTVNVLRNGGVGPMVSSSSTQNAYLPAGYYSHMSFNNPDVSSSNAAASTLSPSGSPSRQQPTASQSMPRMPPQPKQRPPTQFLDDLIRN